MRQSISRDIYIYQPTLSTIFNFISHLRWRKPKYMIVWAGNYPSIYIGNRLYYWNYIINNFFNDTFQFLKQQVEFVNESNVTDLEGVEAGQNNSRMRRIKQPDQQVNRPSIVEPTGRFPIEIKTKIRYHIISFIIILQQKNKVRCNMIPRECIIGVPLEILMIV